jgi:AraC-like DNA-binding protein
MEQAGKAAQTKSLRNALMRCVEKGDLEDAKKYVSALGNDEADYLSHYDLKGLKGFIITLTAMLSMAAERGGADADDLDALTSVFNNEVQAAADVEELRQYMDAIIPGYCKLVSDAAPSESAKQEFPAPSKDEADAEAAVFLALRSGDEEKIQECLIRLYDASAADWGTYPLSGFVTIVGGFSQRLVAEAIKDNAEPHQAYQAEGEFLRAIDNVQTKEEALKATNTLAVTLGRLIADYRKQEKLKEAGYTKEVKRVVHYIEDNLDDEELKRESIARALRINGEWLSRIFPRQVGMTVTDYITDKRLEKAAGLLRNTEKTVGDIAAECGYLDQNYFTRIFKRKFGATPGSYRSGKK